MASTTLRVMRLHTPCNDSWHTISPYVLHAGAAPPPTEADNEELRQKHARTMSDLEHQYELSRYTTHIARGVGFGYGSGTLLSEPPKPSGPPP